jgi:peroxiredoxin
VAQDQYQVLAVSTGDVGEVHEWANKVSAKFPVVVQEKLTISLRYQVVATPFAFLLDEQMHITSKAHINDDRHIRYLLARPAGFLNEEELEAPTMQRAP